MPLELRIWHDRTVWVQWLLAEIVLIDIRGLYLGRVTHESAML